MNLHTAALALKTAALVALYIESMSPPPDTGPVRRLRVSAILTALAALVSASGVP